MRCAEPKSSPEAVEVVRNYRVAYADPIKLAVGERVQLAHEDQQWSGWIWCKTRLGQNGWAPKQIFLPAEDGLFAAVEDFDATELNAESGQTVEILFELNSWAWCRADGGGMGWVPRENLSRPISRNAEIPT